MLARILDLRYIQLGLGILIILGTVFCIFTPNYFLFKLGARFAGMIMLGYLMMGIFFLVLKQPRLMFTSFACCAGLCLFLKNASNSDLRHPLPTNERSIRIAHFNISASADDYESTIETLAKSKADLISIQEVTPDWQYLLKETLSQKYPYSLAITRLDPFGLAVYSKFPISQLDTFFYEDIPNISGIVQLEKAKHRFKFICAHTTPPLYSLAYEKMRNHLKLVAEQAVSDSIPTITIGNFHAPPWWGEIQELRTTAKLADSRRSAAYGISEIFQSPGDYILYSNHFNCLNFKNIITPLSNHLGIQGRYQFKRNAKKAN